MIAVAMATSIRYVSAAPVARLLGCGQPERVISIEKQRYCCVHFNLDCDNIENVEKLRDVVPKFGSAFGSASVVEATTKKQLNRKKGANDAVPSVQKFLKVRILGDRCTSSWVRCATGLECKLGFCVRKRNKANLTHLMQIGKRVEKEEQVEEAAGDDDDDDDPLPAKEDVTIRGQSVEMGEGEVGRAAMIVEGDSEGRVIMADPLPKSVQDLDLNETVIGAKKDKAPEKDKAPSGIEEDEVAANIADYLASIGKKLNDREWHAVRELIAGTIDERAQREDEVDEVADAETDSSSGIDNSGKADSRDRQTTTEIRVGDCTSANAANTNPSGGKTRTEDRRQCLSHTMSK